MSNEDATTRAAEARRGQGAPGGGPPSGAVAAQPGRRLQADAGGRREGDQPTTAFPRPPHTGSGLDAATTALPTGGSERAARPGPVRSEPRQVAPSRPAARQRRARLAVQRVDPWSVFMFSLLASICIGIVLVVAVTALYAALSSLGVLDSVNDLIGEITGDDETGGTSLFSAGRVIGTAAVIAAIDVVLITALATLGAVLYNVCAALTGGIEVVLRERE